MNILIESHYFPSIAYIKLLQSAGAIYIEFNEHYRKGTYRNRCYIAGANGSLRLSVPLEKSKRSNILIKDKKIAYDMDWQKLHWQSLCSAYRRSPYFEYFEDDLAKLFLKKETFLLDLNEKLLYWILKTLTIDKAIHYTTAFEKEVNDMQDARGILMPNKMPEIELPEYHQVFADRNGFLPNLTILDWLFNEGPNSI